MKSKFIMTMMTLLLIAGGSVFANEGHDHDADEDPAMMGEGSRMGSAGMTDHKMDEEGVKAVEVGNKICPVSGNPVDDGKMGEVVKYEYNGKIYNLCCKMCVKDFQKDPEKYSKIAQDEVKKVNEQANVKEDKDDSKEHEGDDDVEMHQHDHSH